MRSSPAVIREHSTISARRLAAGGSVQMPRRRTPGRAAATILLTVVLFGTALALSLMGARP